MFYIFLLWLQLFVFPRHVAANIAAESIRLELDALKQPLDWDLTTARIANETASGMDSSTLKERLMNYNSPAGDSIRLIRVHVIDTKTNLTMKVSKLTVAVTSVRLGFNSFDNYKGFLCVLVPPTLVTLDSELSPSLDRELMCDLTRPNYPRGVVYSNVVDGVADFSWLTHTEATLDLRKGNPWSTRALKFQIFDREWAELGTTQSFGINAMFPAARISIISGPPLIVIANNPIAIEMDVQFHNPLFPILSQNRFVSCRPFSVGSISPCGRDGEIIMKISVQVPSSENLVRISSGGTVSNMLSVRAIEGAVILPHIRFMDTAIGAHLRIIASKGEFPWTPVPRSFDIDPTVTFSESFDIKEAIPRTLRVVHDTNHVQTVYMGFPYHIPPAVEIIDASGNRVTAGPGATSLIEVNIVPSDGCLTENLLTAVDGLAIFSGAICTVGSFALNFSSELIAHSIMTAASKVISLISISLLVPLSGPEAIIGRLQSAAAQVAIDDLISGVHESVDTQWAHSLRLTPHNSAGDPDIGSKAAMALEIPSVRAVVGPTSFRVSRAVSPLFRLAKLPHICLWCSFTTSEYFSPPNEFRTVITQSAILELIVLCKYLASMKWMDIVLISSLNIPLPDIFYREIDSLGIIVAMEIRISAITVLHDELTKIVKSTKRIIVVVSLPPLDIWDIAMAVKADGVHGYQWTGTTVAGDAFPFDNITLNRAFKGARFIVDHVGNSTIWSSLLHRIADPSPYSKRLTRRAAEQVVYVYDAMMVLAHAFFRIAVNNATATPRVVHTAIRSTKLYSGLSGLLSFDDKGARSSFSAQIRQPSSGGGFKATMQLILHSVDGNLFLLPLHNNNSDPEGFNFPDNVFLSQRTFMSIAVETREVQHSVRHITESVIDSAVFLSDYVPIFYRCTQGCGESFSYDDRAWIPGDGCSLWMVRRELEAAQLKGMELAIIKELDVTLRAEATRQTQLLVDIALKEANDELVSKMIYDACGLGAESLHCQKMFLHETDIFSVCNATLSVLPVSVPPPSLEELSYTNKLGSPSCIATLAPLLPVNIACGKSFQSNPTCVSAMKKFLLVQPLLSECGIIGEKSFSASCQVLAHSLEYCHTLPVEFNFENGACVAQDTCECKEKTSNPGVKAYTGANCERPLCSPGCHKGKCVAPDICVCFGNGWEGEACNIAVCPKTCQHGTCNQSMKLPQRYNVEDNICQCNIGFYIDDCSGECNCKLKGMNSVICQRVLSCNTTQFLCAPLNSATFMQCPLSTKTEQVRCLEYLPGLVRCPCGTDGLCKCREGWQGSDCGSRIPPYKIIILVAAMAVAVLFVVGVYLSFVRIRRRRDYTKLANLDWVIDFLDIVFDNNADWEGTMPTSGTWDETSQATSEAKLPTLRKSFISIDNHNSGSPIVGESRCVSSSSPVIFATYKGNPVVVQRLLKREITLTHQQVKEIRLAIDVPLHENLVSLIGVCIKQPHLCIVTDGVRKSDLWTLLANHELVLEWDFLYSLSIDVATGLTYLHDQTGFLSHGDLKSSNIIISHRWVAKLTGFGLHLLRAPFYRNGIEGLHPLQSVGYNFKATAACGSINHYDDQSMIVSGPDPWAVLFWTAPERLRNPGPPIHEELLKSSATSINKIAPNPDCYRTQSGQIPRHDGRGTPEADIYSFGIILWELACRQRPFVTMKAKDAIEQVMSDFLRPDIRYIIGEVSVSYQRLIEHCWHENPLLRPKAIDGLNELRHMRDNEGFGHIDTTILLENYSRLLETIINDKDSELENERRRVELLLYNHLPPHVSTRLRNSLSDEPRTYEMVSVYSSSIVDFSSVIAHSTAAQVIRILSNVHYMFTSIINQYDVFKMVTTNDTFLIVSGLAKSAGTQHACEAANLSLELLASTVSFKIEHLPGWHLQLRIGLHSGPCVGGIIGKEFLHYCLFGDTIYTSQQIERAGLPLHIHLSSSTFQCLRRSTLGFKLDCRGKLNIPDKGIMTTYFLTNRLGFEKALPDVTRAKRSLHTSY